MRGGYILRRQRFSVSRETVTAAHYRLPLSEGIIDRAYATLGLRLVRDALAREPRLYAMGMGGWDKPLPQMLKRLKWRDVRGAVPLQGGPPGADSCDNIRPLRTSAVAPRSPWMPPRFTGAGWLGMKALGLSRATAAAALRSGPGFRRLGGRSLGALARRLCPARPRDAATLDALYPPSDPRFLRVRAAGGWAVLLDTQMRDHKQFGDMRVGTIVDCLAPPDRRRRGDSRRRQRCWNSAASI